MNETYEWLYDHYALPLLSAERDGEELLEELLARAAPEERMWSRDRVDRLLLLRGTDAFAVGLQLGLRLMAGQRAQGLAIS